MEQNLFIWFGLIPFFINLFLIIHNYHEAPSWYKYQSELHQLAEKYSLDFSNYQSAKRYFWQSVYFCALYFAYAVLYNCGFSHRFMLGQTASIIVAVLALPLYLLDILDIMTSSHVKENLKRFDKIIDSTLNVYFGYSSASSYQRSIIGESDYPNFLGLRKACLEYRSYCSMHTAINTFSALLMIVAIRS